MKRILFLLCMLLLMPVCTLRAQIGHWQCDTHAYEYDMTVYVELSPISDLSNYEIAAFCGEECRGVAELIMAGTSQVGYLRIRSNSTSGDTITFRAYKKDTQEELELEAETVSFVSNATLGTPSKPIHLQLPSVYLPGDLNGDGEVDIDDVYLVIDIALGRIQSGYIEVAADVNGDGLIDIDDVYLIIDKALGK